MAEDGFNNEKLTMILIKVDMEKLADGLQKLGEEDLLQVVQMVYDNKTQDTYTKNDVESMPSTIPLYPTINPAMRFIINLPNQFLLG